MKKTLAIILMTALLISSFSLSAFGATPDELKNIMNETASYVYKLTPEPQVASIGGEWAVFGLARSGYNVPNQYYEAYYKNVEKYVKDHKGILHDKKYTEYSRVIIALTSIGYDATNVAGYDLIKPLGDYEKTIWQGINGPTFALIALDSANYEIPQNSEAKTQATRQMYVNRIIDLQLDDGGFSLTGEGNADPDVTAMALQALAKYQNDSKVKTAINKALACLSNLQNNEGGYYSWGSKNSESVVQVIVALNELGIDIEDSRFIKNGKTLVDNLLTFYTKGGGFKHSYEIAGNDGMSTEQGFYGIVSINRALNGQNTLYDMTDVKVQKKPTTSSPSKEENNNGINIKPITISGKTFNDINGHKNQKAIKALAERTIINGVTETSFSPDESMTRAQFATIIVQALGFKAATPTTSIFSDVNISAWYAPYVKIAYDKGIIKGVSQNSFEPEGTITKEEAATMIAQASKICGLDVDSMTEAAARDMLAQFTDYTQVSNWAKQFVAFCYSENILDQSDLEIQSKNEIKRCEIAQMVYNMLIEAELL